MDKQKTYWDWVGDHDDWDIDAQLDKISDSCTLWPVRPENKEAMFIIEHLYILAPMEAKIVTLLAKGLSFEETAKLLAITKGRVQGAVNRARNKFKKLVYEKGITGYIGDKQRPSPQMENINDRNYHS